MWDKIILGALAYAGYRKYRGEPILPDWLNKGAGAGAGGAGAGGLPVASENYEFLSAWTGGAKEGDDVPLVVLLHGQASTPQVALSQFPLNRPARIMAPFGRFADAGGRSFFDRTLPFGDARDKAQRDEVLKLAAAVDAIVEAKDFGVQKPFLPARAVVVGLDVSGALAVGLALGDPLHVRQGWGTGGVVPPSWVPLGLPQLNNLTRPTVRKITYGEAVVLDQETAKLAQSRGWDYVVTVEVAPPPPEKWQAWMMTTLEENLTAG